ncbi:MAG TPA: tetratricopeptide repeat protein [Pirellulales bacterium]|nr:tetratricopeptide repeat protein [Pirellulales bacterium]
MPSSNGPLTAVEPSVISRPLGERPPWSRRATLLAVGAISLAALAAYANSFEGAFVFDDQGWIVENTTIRHLWPISDVLFPVDAARVGGRPIVSLSLALNYALGGVNVWGYHAVNLAIHLAAALVLFGIVRRTLILPRLKDQFGAVATPLAAAVALIWVVHPLQTEAVTYVIQRAESLVGLFYLLTLYCVIRGATSDDRSPQRRTLWYVAAVANCLLGMATKEVMFTAPVLILLYDVIFLSAVVGSNAGSPHPGPLPEGEGGSSWASAAGVGHSKNWSRLLRRAFAERWGLYAAIFATWGVVVWVLLWTNFHDATTGLHTRRFTPWTYLITEPQVIVMYLQLAFWPDSLCFAYDLPPARTLGQIVPPALIILTLLGLTGWALAKRPALGFCAAAFFLILAPTSSFVPILDAAFEHRMYLPLAPLAALVVLGAYRLWSRLRATGLAMRLAPAAVVFAAIVALAWTTVVRNHDYRSELAMWQDTVNKRPNNPRAHCNFGCALSHKKRSDEAIAQYRRALEIDPNDLSAAESYQNLGSELALRGSLDEAIGLFKQAIRARPDYAEAHFNLGLALAKRGQADTAIGQYRDALRLKPDYAEAHNALGELLGWQGKLVEAMAEINAAILLKPDHAPAHANLAGLLARQGKLAAAEVQARRALEIDPRSPDAHSKLAGILALEGTTEDAIAHYQRALAIEPNSAEVHIHLGRLLDSQGKTREAIDHWRQAVRLQPNYPAILDQLAWTLATDPDDSLRDGVEAVELAQRAVQLTGGQNPETLATLAAAEAEVGRYPKAVEIAERALDLAVGQSNRDELATALRDQIKHFYETGFPYHQPRRP